MKNFEVHELVDGWVGQADSLTSAIAMRDQILADVEGAEVKITAEVDEDDLSDGASLLGSQGQRADRPSGTCCSACDGVPEGVDQGGTVVEAIDTTGIVRAPWLGELDEESL